MRTDFAGSARAGGGSNGRIFYPGGAANVGRNLRAFIENVSVIGTVGNDTRGRQLLELLREQEIALSTRS